LILKYYGGSYAKCYGRRGIGHREPLDPNSRARIRSFITRISTGCGPLDYNPTVDVSARPKLPGSARFQMDGPDSILRRNKQFLIPTVYPQIYGPELHAQRGGGMPSSKLHCPVLDRRPGTVLLPWTLPIPTACSPRRSAMAGAPQLLAQTLSSRFPSATHRGGQGESDGGLFTLV
jgi:hypothetical protein